MGRFEQGTSARRPERIARTAVVVAAAAAAVWLAGALAVPALSGAGRSDAAGALHALYAPLCHQRPARCLTVAGEPMALCSRCAGLYAGGIAGLIAGAAAAAWRRRVRPAVFFVAVAPTALQWLSVRFGAPDPGVVARAVLSLPAGAACGWFLAHGLGDLVVRGSGRTVPDTRPSIRRREEFG